MKCTQTILFGLALFSFSELASAEFYTGFELKQKLIEYEKAGSTNYQDAALGMGYVAGVFDVSIRIQHCPPSSVTLGQISSMVLKHLQENPEKLEYSADQHVIYVLKKAWPCPVKQPSTSQPKQPKQSRPSNSNESPF